MAEYLKVTNWEKFQHYKRRNPPWVKLHFEIFSSPDWIALSDFNRLVAVACMLIASRYSGRVPSDPLLIQRIARLKSRVSFKPLIESGFLSEMLADASTLQADARIETETETEKTLAQPSCAIADDWPKDYRERFWEAYPRKVGKKAAIRKLELVRKVDKVQWAKLIDAVGRIDVRDPKFIPHPATWLNAGRWDDEVEHKNGKELDLGFPAFPGSAEFIAWKAYYQDQKDMVLIRLLNTRELEGRPFSFQTKWPPYVRAE